MRGRRWLRLGMVLSLGLLGGRSGWSSTPETPSTQTPSAGRTVQLPLGTVDAVTGTLSLNLPLGPKLPGRIPVGFTWTYNSNYGFIGGEGYSGCFSPVLWPQIGDPSAKLQTTVLVQGESWVFYPQVQNPAMPSDPSWWQTAMSDRGVVLHAPTSGDSAPGPWMIESTGTYHASVVASSDGTKFLVTFGYTTPVSRFDKNTGTTVESTLDLGRGYAILDGPNAIWVQYLHQPASGSPGQTRDQVTHFTNAWGDDVTATETLTQLTLDCWAPEKTVIADTHTGVQTTLSLQTDAPPQISYAGTTYSVMAPQATLTVTSNIPGVSLPTTVLRGAWMGFERFSQPASMGCPGYDVNAKPVPLGVSDWTFVPATVTTQASDGTSRITTFDWTTGSGGVPLTGPLTRAVLPSGLVETLAYGGGSNYSQYSFSPCDGIWTGFSVTSPPQPPSSNGTMVTSTNGDTLGGGSGGVYHITLSDPSDPNAGQTILISCQGPSWTGVGDQQKITWTMGGSPQHTTTILRYPTASPTSDSPFRGVRLTHLSYSDMLSDYAGVKGYLFATSAVLREEAIYGTGAPSNLDAPAGWQPAGATVYQTTVYDGFDFHSWANPTGALLLYRSLPVTAIARRTRIFTPGLPTKVILAGDPGDPAATDVYGPIRTDEWTGPVQTAPTVATVLSQSAASSQVSASSSAPTDSIRRQGRITRHFDWNLLRLLTDSDQKTLDGGTLSGLRGVSSVDFGTTKFSYDGSGRITDQTGARGGFIATEHRTYNGSLPQIADTTKTLTGPSGTAILANPSNPSVVVGEHRTFDATTYQWPKTETDKVDGRPHTINARDGLGRITQETDPLGIVTDTTYDAWGRVATVAREARGGVGAVSSTTTTDANGRWKESSVTADGKTLTSHTDLDAFGRVLDIKTYDASGALATTQTFQYDGFGQKIAQSPVLVAGQAHWGDERWAYDSQGRVTDHWDARGRLLSHVVTQPTWTTMDGVTGVWTTTQDDRGFSRSSAVDLLGQKAAVLDQAGQLSQYWYDQDGHLIQTQQGNQTRAYTYNAMGWLTRRTEPEEGSTFYSNFTLLGTPLLTTQTGRSGNRNTIFTTTLDAHLQPTQITASGPEGTVTRILSYDNGTSNTHLLLHVNETQAIAGLPSQTLSEGYGYDALGRLTTKTISDGDDGFTGNTPSVTQAFTVSQTLDDAGQVTSLTYPSGGGRAAQTATVQYDSRNRPLTVKLDGALRGMMAYGTGQADSVTDTLILGNGAQTVSTVTQGELVRSEHLAASGVIEDNAMTWTAGGLMLSRGPDTFAYDPLQRLSHSRVIGLYGETEDQWFTYDTYGNRVQSNFQYTVAGASTQPTEALAWQGAPTNGNDLPAALTALSPGAPAASAATGSLATGALYDDLGRLSQVWTTPGQSSTLTTWIYDPSGRVVKENGTSYLLESSGLRFKRTKADGTVDYTVYGFGREPLAQFEISAPAPRLAITRTTTLMASRTSSRMAPQTLSGILPLDPAGAYITQPSGPITLAPGQTVNFTGTTDYGTSFTWTFGDGGTATGLTASHAFSGVGTYTVVFRASATGYATTQATVAVTVMAKPSITSFTASPSSLTAGQSSTLAWTTSGASGLAIDQGAGTQTGTSTTVSPTSTTTYTLTATNAAGSVTATVTVAVSAPAPPTITSFTASPSRITSGQSTTLAWSLSGAASVSISGIGTVTGTSLSITPAATTSYTLTATNAAGSNTATITVAVETQLPVITDFWSNPVQISSGQTATLNWAVSQADSLTLDKGIGSVTGSSWTVGPLTTTTYKLTATNLIGSVSATVTVSVGAVGSLVWKKTMVYGFGQELSEDQPGMGTTFIQSDFVGSPSVMTDASGAVIGRSKNLPFGERMSSWGQKTVRRYTNHEDDSDSNAIYMQAREYLPAYGKFAQVDPAYDQTKDDPESWNLYNYVTNNPVTHTDPDGRIASAHTFNWITTSWDDTSWTFYAEQYGPPEGGGGNSSAGAAKEATEPPPSDTTTTAPGDQDDSGTSDGTGAPSKPQQDKAPSVKTNGAQTNVAVAGTAAAVPAAAESGGVGTAIWNGLKAVGGAIETGTLVTVAAVGSLLIMTSDATPKHLTEASDKSTDKGAADKTAKPDAKAEETPTTHPDRFRPVKGTKAKTHVDSGEVWEKDQLHKDHYEVYKNRKKFDKGARDRDVWEDGRPKRDLN